MSMNIGKKRILIVEDDRNLNQGLCRALASSECAVISVYNLREARHMLNTSVSSDRETVDLVLLDINLPDGSGLDLLEEIKEAKPELPVIFLTSNDTDIDIVNGLNLGADDYVTKPFSLAVLRARVASQLRKHEQVNVGNDDKFGEDTKGETDSEVFEIDEYYFDFDKMIFKQDDLPIELSKTEQKLLKKLVSNQGITLSRDRLIDEIWSDSGDFVEENALSVTVKRLRDKLSDKEHIKTIYGIGYSWVKVEP